MRKNEAFRQNLLHLMDMRCLQQADIANSLGIERSTVSRWCNGQSIPKSSTLIKLANCLNTSPSSLMNSASFHSFSDEERLLRNFRSLSPRGRELALERMDELTQLYWYDRKEKVL